MPVNKYKAARLIRSHRYLHKLTQKELSAILGTTQQTITQYETAERLPTPEMLEKISKTLKIPLAGFFDDEESKTCLDEISKKYMKYFCYLKDLVEDRQLRKLVKYYVNNRQKYKGINIFRIIAGIAKIPEKRKRHASSTLLSVFKVLQTRR